MIFVKNSRGGREVNMIKTLSKINLSKKGGREGGQPKYKNEFIDSHFSEEKF